MRADIINQVLTDWTEEFLDDLISNARQKVKSDTGSESIDASIIRATVSGAAGVVIRFQDHLRLWDMRNVSRASEVGPEGIERIKKWIQKKGIENFLSGYKYPTTVTKGGITYNVPMTRILNNIAWGISKKKKRLRRRKWYNQMKGKEVYNLYFDLVNAITDDALKEHKNTVLGKT